jgi:type I restriction enzyme R subunit
MLGDFLRALEDAVLDSADAHQNQKMQLLSDPKRFAGFAKVAFDILVGSR